MKLKQIILGLHYYPTNVEGPDARAQLLGAQKAVDFLAKYYKVRRMKIVVDGRKVGRKYLAVYQDNVSYFKKRSLKKRIVLHEFYHHLAHNNIVSSKGEEQKAKKYARKMIKI